MRTSVLVLLLAACGTKGGDGDDTDGGDSDGGDSDVVTIAQVEAQVFVGCGGGPGLRTCHGREPFQGDLDLTQGHAYDSLVDHPADIGGTRVIPGNVDDSVLWRKLTDDLADDGSEGDPMPLGEAIRWQSLPQDQLDLVRAWIAGGAHE